MGFLSSTPAYKGTHQTQTKTSTVLGGIWSSLFGGLFGNSTPTYKKAPASTSTDASSEEATTGSEKTGEDAASEPDAQEIHIYPGE